MRSISWKNSRAMNLACFWLLNKRGINGAIGADVEIYFLHCPSNRMHLTRIVAKEVKSSKLLFLGTSRRPERTRGELIAAKCMLLVA